MQDNNYLGEPIPFDDDEKPSLIPQATPIGKPGGALPPLASGKSEPPPKIQTFESQSNLAAMHLGKTNFKRPLNKTGQGATRVKTFHAKLGEKSIEFLDEQINEWLDNCDAEVKFTTMTMGLFEAKRPENHLIISVWY